MSQAFDDRLISLTVSLDEQTVTYDQDFYIIAAGCKYTNGNFGECSLRIDNISKRTRDFFATRSTSWRPDRRNAKMILRVGRKSTGLFQVFSGNAIACNPSQPPDIGLHFKSLSMSLLLGQVNAISAPANATLKTICQQVANNINYTLAYEASIDPIIGNYQFTGPAPKQINRLNDLAPICAFADDSNASLVVIDRDGAREKTVIEISAETGMVGVPEVTEVGVRVRMLITGEINPGVAVSLTSKINPAVNGEYVVYKLMYQVASFEAPFYWVLDLKPIKFALGVKK